MKRSIKQNDVVWCESDNSDATRCVYHGYYGIDRYTDIGKWTGEKKIGNSALCNKNYGQVNENEEFLRVDEIENSGLKRDRVCKKCLKIYDKLS